MSATLRDESAAFSADVGHGIGNVKARPRPIPYPSRPHVEELCRTRANGDNTRWNNQVEQRATLIKVAYKEGYDAGERIGFTQSWRWHFACGAIAGAAAVGLLWGAWAPVQRVLAMVGV